MLKTKEETIAWLDKYGVENYTINDDLTVDVAGGVLLNKKELTAIDVKFNLVQGHFNCSNNKLSSLEGCPEKINGNFDCSKNLLNSLEFGPKKISGGYTFSESDINNFEFIPEYCGLGYQIKFGDRSIFLSQCDMEQENRNEQTNKIKKELEVKLKEKNEKLINKIKI